MPHYCSVPGCKHKGSGHLFPSQSEDMLLKWRVAIRRLDETSGKLWMPNMSSDVVCGNHFLAQDYVNVGRKGNIVRRLKRTAVPSVFTTRGGFTQIGERGERLAKRRRVSDVALLNLDDIGNEVEVGCESLEVVESSNESRFQDVGAQTESSSMHSKFSIHNFISNDRAIHYYTGFDNYYHFKFFYNALGPAANSITGKCRSLCDEDQLFLTLAKIRQNMNNKHLSILFGVSLSTASKIFLTWCNFMYYQLKEIDIWPTKQVVTETIPRNFRRHFPGTRVILDATEIPIEKPEHVNLQSSTFSTYKNKNTVKAMVGITPRGLVSFVSDCYAGSTSDRQVIEDSVLYKDAAHHFQSGDSIMADRGIMVQDIFAAHDVSVNTPTLLRGKSQLEPEEVVMDRRVASKRIHVERVIGLAKTYKILKHGFSHRLLPMSSKITFICFMLVNFRRSIVHDYA